jgi:hypothetical protein
MTIFEYHGSIFVFLSLLSMASVQKVCQSFQAVDLVTHGGLFW